MLEQGDSVCNVRGEGQDCTVYVCVFLSVSVCPPLTLQGSYYSL